MVTKSSEALLLPLDNTFWHSRQGLRPAAPEQPKLALKPSKSAQKVLRLR